MSVNEYLPYVLKPAKNYFDYYADGAVKTVTFTVEPFRQSYTGYKNNVLTNIETPAPSVYGGFELTEDIDGRILKKLFPNNSAFSLTGRKVYEFEIHSDINTIALALGAKEGDTVKLNMTYLERNPIVYIPFDAPQVKEEIKTRFGTVDGKYYWYPYKSWDRLSEKDLSVGSVSYKESPIIKWTVAGFWDLCYGGWTNEELTQSQWQQKVPNTGFTCYLPSVKIQPRLHNWSGEQSQLVPSFEKLKSSFFEYYTQQNTSSDLRLYSKSGCLQISAVLPYSRNTVDSNYYSNNDLPTYTSIIMPDNSTINILKTFPGGEKPGYPNFTRSVLVSIEKVSGTTPVVAQNVSTTDIKTTIIVGTLSQSDTQLVGANPFGIKGSTYDDIYNDNKYLSALARYLGYDTGDSVELIMSATFQNTPISLYTKSNSGTVNGIKAVDGSSYGFLNVIEANKIFFSAPIVQSSPTPTNTLTPTQTPSITPTNTNTPTNSRTPTTSLSSTPQATITPTFTRTPSSTPTNTPTTTTTTSITPTKSLTPTIINRSNDPFFNNVSLLIYGKEGVLKDYSKHRHSSSLVKYASVSNYQSDSDQKPSFRFNYGSYILVTPSDSDSDTSVFQFGLYDFTVEGYVYLTKYANRGNGGTFLFTTEGRVTAFNFSISVSGRLEYWNSRTNTSMSSNNAIPLATWKHVAFSRENGTLRSFIDGVLVNSISDSSDLNMDWQICIGSNQYYRTEPCYLDGIRITNGVARYNSNFTPPVLPEIESLVTTPLPTLTPTPTLSITPSITASQTPTLTSTTTLTSTSTPTVTPTNTSTTTRTPTATKTPTPSITASATVTSTPTQTNTQTPTTTNTLTPTPTTTPSLSPTSTITVTPTSTLTRTATPTSTVTPTPSATKAATAYAENINGVLSNVATNPTFINLTNGRNRLTGSITSGVRDYLRFSINSGLHLENIVLVSYTAAPSASNSLSLKLGSIWNVSDNTVATDTINSSKVGSSLLSITNNSSLTQTNYSLAIDGDTSSYSIDIYMSIIPPTQTPTNTCTPTPTSTITLTPTNTSTTTLTPTPTTTTTTTATSSLTPTPTPTNTTTLTATPTITSTKTPTPTVTSTITRSPTATPSNTASVTPTPSQNILTNNSAQQIVQWGLGSTGFPALTSNIITCNK